MIIYDANGKRVHATEADAAGMVQHCGYSYEWPPEKKVAAPAAEPVSKSGAMSITPDPKKTRED